jgi:hypothetical protein
MAVGSLELSAGLVTASLSHNYIVPGMSEVDVQEQNEDHT